MRLFVMLITLLPLAVQQRWSLEHRCSGTEQPVPTSGLQSLDSVEPHIRAARGRMFDYGVFGGLMIEEKSARAGSGRPMFQKPDPCKSVRTGHFALS